MENNSYPKKKKFSDKYRNWFVVLAAVLIALAIAAGAHFIQIYNKPKDEPPASSSQLEDILMPDLIGLSAQGAKDILFPITENVKFLRVNGAEILFLSDFTVSEQIPEANAIIDLDEEVTLICTSPEENS